MANEIVAALAAKAQSTATVKPIINRKSSAISVMAKSLVADAEREFDELMARTQKYLVGEEIYYPGYRGARKVEDIDPSVNKCITDFKTIIKKHGDKPTSALRKAILTRAETHYEKDWGGGNSKHAVDAISGIKGIWKEIDHTGFQMTLNSELNDIARRLRESWASSGKSLYVKYKGKYADFASNKPITPLRDMNPTTAKAYAGCSRDERELFGRALTVLRMTWERTFMRDRLKAIEQAMRDMQLETNAKSVYLTARGEIISQGVIHPEYTTLVPFDVVSFEIEELPMLRGYRNKRPDAWARVMPVLSSTGEVVSGARALPLSKPLTSHQRWVAADEYWDETLAKWTAHVNDLGYWWDAGDLGNPPRLVTTSYVSGKELITRDALRISDGSCLVSRFNSGLDSLGSFTLSMVLSPNPVSRPFPLLDYYHRGEAPEPFERFGWWFNDRFDYYYGGNGNSVDQMASIAKLRPMVITSTVDNGVCTTTIGYSPRHNFSTAVKTKRTNLTQWMRFQIGGSYLPLDEDSYSDINLYEFNIWTRALTPDEVTALHSDFYSIYGVGNDWR